jgi:beta-lactamase class A
MKPGVFLLFLILACSILACKPKKTITMHELHQQINDTLARQSGKFAVVFHNLPMNETLEIRHQELFHAASTMKTAVMIEVYKQAAEGKFSMDDSIAIHNEFKSIVDSSIYSLDPADDSELGLYQQIGQKRKVSDLVYDMIIVSSNLATNLVIELVGPEQVTKTMRDLGAVHTEVLRGVEDQKAFDKGLNNVTTAADMAIIFKRIAEGDAVNPQASGDMTRILLDQKFNEIIPARLPADVKVAHKTGSITGVRHDCGIVFLPDGRKYVLVLLSKEMEDEEAGIKAMATVSEMIYAYVTQ